MPNMIISLYRYMDWSGGLERNLGIILSLGFTAVCVMVILAVSKAFGWQRFWVPPLIWLLLEVNAGAQTTNSNWNSGLQKTLGIILSLGFIAGCVMVIGGFLAAKRDENWKMTVLYGVGVAGASALMSALFTAFGQGGAVVTAVWGQ
jgi:hypothetical protein